MSTIDVPLNDAPLEEEMRLIDVIDLLFEGKEVFFRYIKTVADIMTTEVATLPLDNKVGDALTFLRNNSVRHIPIIEEIDSDEEPRQILIGVVSQRDVARVVSPGVGTTAQTDEDEKALALNLSAIMSRALVVVGPETTIFDACQLLVEHKLDSVLVTKGADNEKEILGILTTTDIIKCFQRMEVLRRARPDTTQEPATTSKRLIDLMGGGKQPTDLVVHSMMGKVSDIMQEKPVTLEEGDELGAGARLMQEERIRHLPITNQRGKLVGILSDRDILLYLPNKQNKKTPVGDSCQKKFRTTLFDLDNNDPDIAAALKQPVSIAMTPAPFTVKSDTPLLTVAALLCDKHIGCVPVVNEADEAVAILTQTDFIGVILALGRFMES